MFPHGFACPVVKRSERARTATFAAFFSAVTFRMVVRIREIKDGVTFADVPT